MRYVRCHHPLPPFPAMRIAALLPARAKRIWLDRIRTGTVGLVGFGCRLLRLRLILFYTTVLLFPTFIYRVTPWFALRFGSVLLPTTPPPLPHTRTPPHLPFPLPLWPCTSHATPSTPYPAPYPFPHTVWFGSHHLPPPPPTTYLQFVVCTHCGCSCMPTLICFAYLPHHHLDGIGCVVYVALLPLFGYYYYYLPPCLCCLSTTHTPARS